MMMHTTLTQLRNLKLEGLAAALEEQLGMAGMGAMSFEERMLVSCVQLNDVDVTAACGRVKVSDEGGERNS